MSSQFHCDHDGWRFQLWWKKQLSFSCSESPDWWWMMNDEYADDDDDGDGDDDDDIYR